MGLLDGKTAIVTGAARGIGTVSYTHLDVYKRQACIGDSKVKAVFVQIMPETAGMSEAEGVKAAIEAVKSLSLSSGIPQKLHEINVKEEDIPALAAFTPSASLIPAVSTPIADVYKRQMQPTEHSMISIRTVSRKAASTMYSSLLFSK